MIPEAVGQFHQSVTMSTVSCDTKDDGCEEINTRLQPNNAPHNGALPSGLLYTSRIPTKLFRFLLISIDVKSNGSKFWFLSAHLGERKRKRDAITAAC